MLLSVSCTREKLQNEMQRKQLRRAKFGGKVWGKSLGEKQKVFVRENWASSIGRLGMAGRRLGDKSKYKKLNCDLFVSFGSHDGLPARD